MGSIQLSALKCLLPLEMLLGVRDSCIWLADVAQELWEIFGPLGGGWSQVGYPGCRRWSLILTTDVSIYCKVRLF